MSWQVGYYKNGEWVWSRQEHDDEQSAIVSVTFATGLTTFAELEPNGSYRVRYGTDGLACVRQLSYPPSIAPGADLTTSENLGPLRRYRGLTWVGWLNYLVLRWFLVRLQYTVETNDGSISQWKLKFCPTWRW